MARIWFDGELVSPDDASPSFLAHTLHYGVGVFEGIRSYAWEDGSACVFRLNDHLRRLEDSARVCGLVIPFDRDTLARAAIDVLEANELRDGYLRPLVYQDDGQLSGLGSMPQVRVLIAAETWGPYLGEEGLRKGIRTMISSYRRGGHGSLLSKAKICGQYVISTLAKRRALALGYDEALLTDDDGYVAEGSGENLFVVRDGVLKTPPSSAPILPGLTRDTILSFARDLGEQAGIADIQEINITRDELLIADEVFLTGTAAEVTPVREIDDVPIGQGTAGPVTRALQDAFFDLVCGRAKAPEGWRTPFGTLVR